MAVYDHERIEPALSQVGLDAFETRIVKGFHQDSSALEAGLEKERLPYTLEVSRTLW